MLYTWSKKGSIQKKEDSVYYNMHKKEIEKAFKRAYQVTRFDMEPVYSRSGKPKAFIKRKQDGYEFETIRVYKKIKQAKNRYIAEIRSCWDYRTIIGGYDTYEEAVDAVRHYYTINYLWGHCHTGQVCGHILSNRALTEKIFKDILEKLSLSKSSK